MANIDEVLDSIKGEAVELIKQELRSLLTDAQKDADAMIRETGRKVADWLLMRAQGQLSDDEFEALLYSRDQLLRQYKNTVEIETRARLEKIAVALINLVLDRLFGVGPTK
ncbi:MAG: hypothetical protein ACM3Y9_10850 [Ignavibacteria bacterium]